MQDYKIIGFEPDGTERNLGHASYPLAKATADAAQESGKYQYVGTKLTDVPCQGCQRDPWQVYEGGRYVCVSCYCGLGVRRERAS